MIKKIMNLVGVGTLSKTEQIEVLGGDQAFIAASFMCYCNTIYVGEKKSVKDCWKSC